MCMASRSATAPPTVSLGERPADGAVYPKGTNDCVTQIFIESTADSLQDRVFRSCDRIRGNAGIFAQLAAAAGSSSSV